MARILLIDDEKLSRALYGDYLRGSGHEVTTVHDFASARSALAASAYDVLVTDMLLPGGDGLQVIHYVKERYPGVEVVVITALDKVEPAVRAIKGGAAEYLVKPVVPEVLQHAVRRALATRELLRENASLRRYVSLMEMGQRIATTLDREQLAEAVCTALGSLVPGAGVVLVEREAASGALRRMACRGVAEGDQKPLAEELAARLEGVRERMVLKDLPGSRTHGEAFPVLESSDVLGHLVLLCDDPPSSEPSESAGFIARCLALALRNLGRIAEVEDQLYLDDLTHLFNTRYLHTVLDREVKSALQTRGSFSLLFLDLDYFKSINDTHGHLVGSRVLVEMARVLKGCVREQDVVARYGGDEYVVLLRNTDSGGALKVAERIRHTVESHRFLAREGANVALSTCIGVASFPEHAQDKRTLLELADHAMYRGKRGSRNVVYMAAREPEPMKPAAHGMNGGG